MLKPAVERGQFRLYKSTTSYDTEDRRIEFLFNPEELSRKLNPSFEEVKNKGSKEPLKISYPPEEEISLKIILDATDYFEVKEEDEELHGIAPEIAALELLLYPTNINDLHPAYMKKKKGSVKIKPVYLPLILFIWGESRALPVNITGISITEKAFDTKLNPIRAEVDVTMKVLTWKELTEEAIFNKYMANIQEKDRLANYR
jgi:hypothetical protein